MKISWIQGLEKELKVDVTQNFKESLVIRRRLEELLSDKISESQRTARSKVTYDNPNWAFLQADQRGYERALEEVISLISTKSVDKD